MSNDFMVSIRRPNGKHFKHKAGGTSGLAILEYLMELELGRIVSYDELELTYSITYDDDKYTYLQNTIDGVKIAVWTVMEKDWGLRETRKN